MIIFQNLKTLIGFSLLAAATISSPIVAQTSTIEVGTASLPAQTTVTSTTPSIFTRISFTAPFAAGVVPNVFPMTPEFGTGAADDPCTIRIRNVDNLGFDAVCLEPLNEDRNNPAATFNYIAITDGTLNVPIVGSADTVGFESRCTAVTNQQYGNNGCCCTGTRNFASQAFLSPAFATPPALLTQIKTTNNIIPGCAGLPTGEPETLDTSIQANSLATTGFNWALERMEAGNGAIASGETICYLAVERDGCKDLDFSSFDAPASVDFAAVHGNNADGHDNGATTGEGAAFPVGCFSSAPITLGNTRSRNGGMLRLASVNTSEAIFT
ncbi:MAG: hypothetical protein ACJAQ6_000535 [Arenicella sp.]|jgi:hypothetical protein